MKLLVISDTHGYLGNAVSAIEKERPDYILHLGDVADDCDELTAIYPNKLIVCVLGNNDFFCKKYPVQRQFELHGKKIFMCHGHKYNVKQSLYPLIKAAETSHIVLYGHTHIPHLEEHSDMIIMNPGSISSYGIISITDDDIKAEIIKL